MERGLPNLFSGTCRIHHCPMPCHFASFDFAFRAGNVIGIGTAEFQPDGVVLVEVVDTTPEIENRREPCPQASTNWTPRFTLQREHFRFAEALEIMRLPALGTIEFEGRALRIGDSIPLAELGYGELVFDLQEAASGDFAREPERHEETAR